MAGEIRGRAPWELTPERLQTIRDLAADGVNEADIARVVGLAPQTFSSKKRIHPEIDEAIKEAKAVSHQVAAGFLRRMWADPDHPKHLPALLFYLKTQHGWREKEPEQEKQLPTQLTLVKVDKLAKDEGADE